MFVCAFVHINELVVVKVKAVARVETSETLRLWIIDPLKGQKLLDWKEDIQINVTVVKR